MGQNLRGMGPFLMFFPEVPCLYLPEEMFLKSWCPCSFYRVVKKIKIKIKQTPNFGSLFDKLHEIF